MPKSFLKIVVAGTVPALVVVGALRAAVNSHPLDEPTSQPATQPATQPDPAPPAQSPWRGGGAIGGRRG